MKKNNIPNVVIVGKPNVGKSALFNKLANNERALVYDLRGVTRDSISDFCTWNDFTFKITDTAGISEKIFKYDSIGKQAIIEAEKILRDSDIAIVLFDGSNELTAEDFYLFNFVKKITKNYFIVSNKFDKKSFEENKSLIEAVASNSKIINISAAHSKGIEDLVEYIKKLSLELGFSKEDDFEKKNFRVTFLGRPNVGKSSLLNALLGKERSIVSDIAGTTREVVSEIIEIDDFKISICDTAGVRRSRSIDERLEELSVSNTMRALEKSHIIIVVFDLSSDDIYDQDIKLAAHAFQDLHRAVIIVWNKIDLIEESKRTEKMDKILGIYKNIFIHMPHIYTSAKEKINVNEIKDVLKEVWKNYKFFFKSEDVLYILSRALKEKPIVRSRQSLVIKKLTILKSGPLTISIKVNNVIWFEEAQLGYLSNILRKYYNLTGCPIKWIVY